MAAKLCVANPDQTRLLAQYVFNLARYDQDYDIRDRARFMRAFVFPSPGHEDDRLVRHARKVRNNRQANLIGKGGFIVKCSYYFEQAS